MNQLLAVCVGGGIGSLMRYGIGQFIANRFRPVFPLATLCSNVLSCLLLGLTLVYFKDKAPSVLKTFIVVGICGGFSTFSTFSHETLELIRTGNWLYAFINILISLILCLGILFAIVKVP